MWKESLKRLKELHTNLFLMIFSCMFVKADKRFFVRILIIPESERRKSAAVKINYTTGTSERHQTLKIR